MKTSAPGLAATPRRLSRREWALVGCGVVAWIAIGAGGVWFVHLFTRPPGGCASATAGDAPTHQAKAAAPSPGNAFQALTGQGRCP